MVAAQSTYTARIGDGVNGGRATTSPCKEDAYIADEALQIGRGVQRRSGNTDKLGSGVTVAAASPFHPTNFLGITILPTRGEYNVITGSDGAPDGTPLSYPTGDTARVASEGDYWVITADAVDPGDAVTVVAATGVLGSDTPSATHGLLPGAQWMTKAAAGGLAIVRLDGSIY